jgi:type III restriction enzyme
MDESHHYRAEKGAQALNELHPLLGLELTATPLVASGSKQIPFKNVVYEYPLSSAIKDGYSKIPYAMTRRDTAIYNLSKEEVDKMMLSDGIMNHERVKERLKDYAINNGTKPVKPFVLVVCQNTEHAEWVLDFVTSEDFFNGRYKEKTIIIHSNQKGAEREENVQKLLEVEKIDNPVEIVIHVNILKEGWDVNNLYTIIPLRTAASQTLREQTIGRGLRLPYGKRVGVQDVDALVITAHDKFEEIVKEASDPKSLLKAGNIIYADDIETEVSVKVDSNVKKAVQESMFDLGVELENAEDMTSEERAAVVKAVEVASKTLIETYKVVGRDNLPKVDTKTIVETAVRSEDLAEIVKRRTDFTDIIMRFTGQEIEKQRKIIETESMAIPQIKVSRDLKVNYYFKPFDLDLSVFNYYPVSNEVLYQSLVDTKDTSVMSGKVLDFNALNPMKELVFEIMNKPEIDYDECSDLLYDLFKSVINKLEEKFTAEEVRNIVMFNKKDISNKVYAQMKENFVCSTPDIIETVNGVSYEIIEPSYMRKIGEEPISLFSPIEDGQVPKVLFSGFKKALHFMYKFDSAPEKRFAIVCENDPYVLKWLRPAPKQFNLFYNGNKRYEPDFVVETDDCMYLVEIKGEDRINDEDNIAKKERAMRYCRAANVYCEGHELKNWKYLYIPSQQVQTNSSFNNLVQRFEVVE